MLALRLSGRLSHTKSVRLRMVRDLATRIEELVQLVRAASSWAWTTSNGRPALRLESSDGARRLKVLSPELAAEVRARLPDSP